MHELLFGSADETSFELPPLDYLPPLLAPLLLLFPAPPARSRWLALSSEYNGFARRGIISGVSKNFVRENSYSMILRHGNSSYLSSLWLDAFPCSPMSVSF